LAEGRNRECQLLIALVTGRAARHIVDAMSSDYDCAYVVELPINVMSYATVDLIERILSSKPAIVGRLRVADVVIIPGSVKGDTERLESVVGVPVYKGTRSAIGIPYVIEHILMGGKLDTQKPADEILPQQPLRIEYDEAFSVRGVTIPRRGPPVVLVSEIPPDITDDKAVSLAERYAREGARIVLVGTNPEWDKRKLQRRIADVSRALEGYEVLVGSEAPNDILAKAAIDEGAALLSTSPVIAQAISGLLGDEAVIVGDRDLRVLKSTVGELEEVGLTRVIVDPVLDLPLMGFIGSIRRYMEADMIGKPLLFSAANVYEEIEADTHGVQALLATIAVELGASVYLVVEDSYKGVHATSEASEAIRVASIAWSRGTTERGLYSRLLTLKQSKPPGTPSLPPGEPVGDVRPSPDPAGYFIITVDHERGVIIVEFRGRDKVIRLEGRHALSLAREVVRRTGITSEHSAYLGYELGKAELALRLGRTYTQDEPLIVAVWDHG